MPKQYDLLYPRPYKTAQGEQTHWMNVGKAFEAKAGGFDILLYVMPPPNAEGVTRIIAREDTGERRDGRPSQNQQPQQGRQGPPTGYAPQHRERGYQGGGYGPHRGPQEEVPMPGGDAQDDIPF
jgi:hypothetical protein